MSYVNPALERLSTKKLSKARIEKELDKHYQSLELFLRGVENNNWSMIVNGPAGSGKSEIVKEVLGDHDDCLKVSGSMSAVMLYTYMHKMKKKGQILIIDDTDKVLEDIECLEVLKAGLGSSGAIDWSKYSNALQKTKTPKKFTYQGRMVIITNKSFKTQTEHSTQMTRLQEAQSPLLSRVQYFRAGLPNAEWQIEALKFYQKREKLLCFQDEFGKQRVPMKVQNLLIKYISDNRDEVREISFRTLANLLELYEQDDKNWEMMANASLWH